MFYLDRMLDLLPNYAYCESYLLFNRSLQPLNSISNLLILAYAVFYFIRRRQQGETMGLVLLPALFLLGISSAAWHISNHKIFLLFDIIAVFLVIGVLLWQFARRFTLQVPQAFAILFVSLLVIFVLGNVLFPLNLHAGGFLLLGLILMSLSLVHSVNLTYDRLHIPFLWVGMLLSFGAIMRSADLSTCALTPAPFGTHFIWHIAAFYAIIIMIEHMRNIPYKSAIKIDEAR